MPTLTRWYIKTAMIHLIAALLLALILLLRPLLNLPQFIAFMNPGYFHLFMVGWVTEMIFGVIYWMFPIITRARPRGSDLLGWSSYVLLNIGLLLRVIGEPLSGVNPTATYGWLLVASALFQWLAGIAFVINSWPRVKDRYRGE